MKLTPLLRFSRSFSGVKPSRIDGDRSSSDSVNIHWLSTAISTSSGRAGGAGERGVDLEMSVAAGIFAGSPFSCTLEGCDWDKVTVICCKQ